MSVFFASLAASTSLPHFLYFQFVSIALISFLFYSFLSPFFIAFIAEFLLYKQPRIPRGPFHLSRCLRLSPPPTFVNHCGAESPFALCFNAVTSLLFLPPPSSYHYLVSPV